MKRLVTLMMCAVSLGAAAQSTITYPYNPDGNADALIGVTDLQDMLSTYGGAFSPSEILLDGETLTTVLTQLQNSIDSLSGLTGGGGSVLDMPLGTVLPIATESVPEGWMLCDGREISIEEYQGLYDLIGTTYGAGDSAFWAQVFYPATTFNIPDLRGRTIIGTDNMGGEPSGILSNHEGALGSIGGEEEHQLTVPELPQHLIYSSFSERNDLRPFSGENAVVDIFTQLIGNDQPHNNMQPYMALNYMMKVEAAEDVFGEINYAIAGLQEQLDELQLSVFQDSRQLECAAMGAAWNCSAFDESIGYYSLEPQSSFVFPLTLGCSCDAGVPSSGPTWRQFNLLGYPADQEFKLLFQYQASSNSGTSVYRSSVIDLVEIDEGMYSFYAHTQNYPPNNGPCSTNGLPTEDTPSNAITVKSVGGYSQSSTSNYKLTVLLGNKQVGHSFYIDFGF